MAILKPDTTTTMNGVTVNEYLLTKHNPNHIAMPSASMEGKIIGVTVHNTDWISVASGTTPAEQYTRATVNGNMKDVRVHYYVDNTCAWQNLPHSLSGWHAADGSGNGNRRTIAIECIMSSAYNVTDKKSEDNCARLAAALLKKYNLDINHLFTHTHWLNVRDGKSGTVGLSQYRKKSVQGLSAVYFAALVRIQGKSTKVFDRCKTDRQKHLSHSQIVGRCKVADWGIFLIGKCKKSLQDGIFRV